MPSLSAFAGFAEYRDSVTNEPSLISFYTFEASNATDSFGTNHGTLSGTTGFTNSATGAGTALALPGSGFVKFGVVPAFLFSNGLGTVETWLRARWATNFATHDPLICGARTGTSGSTTRWGIHLRANRNEVMFHNGTGYSVPIPNAGTNWHHLAVTFSNSVVRFYWDGTYVGATNRPFGTAAAPSTQISSTSGSLALNYWIGDLDEMAFYSDALADDRIAAHYNSLLGASPPVVTSGPTVSPTNVVTTGDSFSISIVASGSTPLSYFWRKGGIVFTNGGITTVAFSNVTSNNAGAYDVIVSNSVNSVTSAVVNVTVLPANPVVANIGSDFQAGTPKSGWAYLQSTAATGGTESALTYGSAVGNNGNVGYGGGANTYNLGAILGTTTGANSFRLFVDGANNGVVGTDVLLHPGDPVEIGGGGRPFVIARYTIQSNSVHLLGRTATITGSFRRLLTGGDGVQVFVYHNSAPLFAASSGGALSQTAGTFNTVAQVNAGDTISFVLGINGNLYGDETALRGTITLSRDTNPPVLVGPVVLLDTNRLLLTFSESVAFAATNFALSGGASILSATAGGMPNLVSLTTTALVPGQTYTLTINGVADLSTNTIAPDTTTLFTALDPANALLSLLRPEPEPDGPATRRGALTISEIMYHPATRTDALNLEFIEIHNTSPWAKDLSGWRITGEVNFTFPSNTTIAAKGYLVVAAVPADLQSAHGITGVLGPWTGGALNNNGATLRLRNPADAVFFEVSYDNEMPWPAAPDGGGPSLVLARPSLGMNDPRAWDMSANPGGSPGTAEPTVPNPWRAVVCNEVLANSTNADFVELFNLSSTGVDLTGCVLTDNPSTNKFVFPTNSSIAARGFVSLHEAQLGFAFHADGDTIYFKSPAGHVLDAVKLGDQSFGVALGRFPDGAPAWQPLATPTPGDTNASSRRGEVVFSEIMFHPITGSADDEFVELANRTTNAISLDGWRLRGSVDFDFPSNTTIAANGFLVVANKAAHLNTNHPGLGALGNYAGTLGNSGGTLRLARPELLQEINTNGQPITTTIYPVVDSVTYRAGGRWGDAADAGGSSLELTDLRGDPNFAPSWAESDESATSDWKIVEATGVVDNSISTADQLQILLLGAGECLVDDVEVTPAGGGNLVVNGGFESGTSGWVFQGTHLRSTVELVGVTGLGLHLCAAERGDTANRVYKNLSTSIASGTTATIRAKVKWLRGSPEILLRLRGGGLEATTNMLTTLALGTPGAVNSRAVTNAPPAIADVQHQPVLPAAGQIVTVLARVADPDGAGTVLLKYRFDPSAAIHTVAMTPIGGGYYGAFIPGQASGTLAAFHIVATDNLGASALFPQEAPARECLIRWGETQPANFDFGVYRMWMTQAKLNEWNTRQKNSNEPLDCTFVYGGIRAIYNAGANYSGSPFHTPMNTGPLGVPCDYQVNLPGDDRLCGDTLLLICLPGSPWGSNLSLLDYSYVREQAIWWIAREIRMPAIHRRFVQFHFNGTQRNTIFEDTQQPAGEFLRQWWPDDNDGHLHKAQDWIEMADDGVTFLTYVRADLGNYTTSGGARKLAAYRFRWAARSVETSANDYADLFTLVEAHNQANANLYLQQAGALSDADSWARAWALHRISGNWDSWGWRFGKNMYGYKPVSAPWAMIPWDLDFCLGINTGDGPNSDLFSNIGDPIVTKFLNTPVFRRAYWRAFHDMANGPMAPEAVNTRIDAEQAALSANGITPDSASTATAKSYLTDRRNFILTQLSTVASSFSVSGPTTFSTLTNTLSLSGTAPVNVRTIDVNGHELALSWSTVNNWSASALVLPGTNTLVVRGVDSFGRVVGSVTLTVTFTGTNAWPALRINEWMADNGSFVHDPADGKSQDWFELFNPTTNTVDLGGWYLTDNLAQPYQFRVPPNGHYTIPPMGFLLVWADAETNQNTAAHADLHAEFKLERNGEQLGLFALDGTQVDAVTFGSQQNNVSEGRFPDGAQWIYSMTSPTPRGSNTIPALAAPFTIGTVTSLAGNSVELTFATVPGLRYVVEFKNDLGDAEWTPLGALQTASDTTLSITNAPVDAEHRFYRLRREP